jgi:hypothetical protein
MRPRTTAIIFLIVFTIFLAIIYFLYQNAQQVRQKEILNENAQATLTGGRKDLTPEEKVLEVVKKLEESENNNPDQLKKQQEVLETVKKLK